MALTSSCTRLMHQPATATSTSTGSLAFKVLLSRLRTHNTCKTRCPAVVAAAAHDISPPGTYTASGIELGRFIGRGAVGSVYEGCLHGVPLAVKVAHQSTEPLPEEYGAEEAEEKLLHEVMVYSKLARIQGTFVPRLVAHGTLMSDAGEPFPFLATTRIGRGRPLYAAAAEARLGPAQLAAVARNAMAAIAAVHKQGVAHCDVHSPNVLLDDDLSVKLVGFSDAELQLSQSKSQPYADACNGDLADMRGTLCEMIEECLNVDCQQAWAVLQRRTNWHAHSLHKMNVFMRLLNDLCC